MNVATIRKVREPFGILGNMSPHRVTWDGLVWPTSEALFQALRFAQANPIREQIRAERNPMKAKMLAKAHAAEMITSPMSAWDIGNMTHVLAAKLEQHKDVQAVLASTGSMLIVEDCTNRQRGSGLFWGAALRDGQWIGENWLGRLWMDLRV